MVDSKFYVSDTWLMMCQEASSSLVRRHVHRCSLDHVEALCLRGNLVFSQDPTEQLPDDRQ